jgi:hypothetical protein
MESMLERLSAEQKRKRIAFVFAAVFFVAGQFYSDSLFLHGMQISLLFAIAVDLMSIQRTRAICVALRKQPGDDATESLESDHHGGN